MNALVQGFSACRLGGREAIAQDDCENLHHLPIAVFGRLELASHALEAHREEPVLEDHFKGGRSLNYLVA